MKRIHNREKEQFKKLFKQENIDDFEDRFKILEVFLQNEHHLTVGELTQLLNESGYQF
ncbi:MAG: Fur family transcriptional regulator, partial [Deltaproteobacteria bacterium]|nr:Fur family transcriptional regulator [Deltaproteobacteria bacterium]